MNDSVSLNKNVLLGLAAVVAVLAVAVLFLLFRPQGSGSGKLELDGNMGTVQSGAPGHASGYPHADLMPAPPSAGGTLAAPGGASVGGGVPAAGASSGHATGYPGANLMPAPPSR